MEVSLRLSREIYDDGMAAFHDPAHPCHPFVRWQRENGCPEFQLPEPFSGRRSMLRLVFVGMNPGFTADEDMPKAATGISFEKYDSFYRGRFDDDNRDQHSRLVVRRDGGRRKVVRFWNGIERFCRQRLSDLVGCDFRLGEHAVLIETVRYKSKSGWMGDSPSERQAIANHERKMTHKLLEDLLPKIVVAVGGKALCELAKILKFELEPPVRVKNVLVWRPTNNFLKAVESESQFFRAKAADKPAK
jgi:hypothetical protein